VIEEWANDGCLEYLGEREDVRDVIAAADVVVLPSYYREGVPKSLLEALSMGKSIITTDTPGCRETVADRVNGLLIPPRDEEALTTSIRFMLTHPAERKEMGRASRRLAVERFDARKVNAAILEAMNIP
jgi:glycosyltransferase involved in cell wall biosynthesis